MAQPDVTTAVPLLVLCLNNCSHDSCISLTLCYLYQLNLRIYLLSFQSFSEMQSIGKLMKLKKGKKTEILCVWGPPSLLSNVYGGPFPGGKARPGRDADHSPLSSAELVND
jgi:hypothetical protein